MTDAAHWLPFRLMLAVPVETMLGRLTRAQVLEGIVLQLAWIAAFLVLLRFVWNAGMKRFAAFGG